MRVIYVGSLPSEELLGDLVKGQMKVGPETALLGSPRTCGHRVVVQGPREEARLKERQEWAADGSFHKCLGGSRYLWETADLVTLWDCSSTSIICVLQKR